MDTPQTAAELVADHTGHQEYVIADEIADALGAAPLTRLLTSADRLRIATVVAKHLRNDTAPPLVNVELWDDGVDGPAVLVLREQVSMPTAGDGVFNKPVFIHPNGRRDYALSLRVRRLS